MLPISTTSSEMISGCLVISGQRGLAGRVLFGFLAVRLATRFLVTRFDEDSPRALLLALFETLVADLRLRAVDRLVFFLTAFEDFLERLRLLAFLLLVLARRAGDMAPLLITPQRDCQAKNEAMSRLVAVDNKEIGINAPLSFAFQGFARTA